ncbi:MAG: hypothetical protein V8S24_07775 [Gordonibacter pamelaeae]
MSLAALFVSTISLADGDFVSIHRWMFTTVFPTVANSTVQDHVNSNSIVLEVPSFSISQ